MNRVQLPQGYRATTEMKASTYKETLHQEIWCSIVAYVSDVRMFRILTCLGCYFMTVVLIMHKNMTIGGESIITYELTFLHIPKFTECLQNS